MDLKDRLLLFIEYKGIDKASFERLSDLSNGFVDKSGDNTRKASLDKISNAFPELNIAWLRTGQGDMLLSNANIQGNNSVNNSSIIGNTHIGSGNSVNVSLPDKGYQKIIKPDGTIEITPINCNMSERVTPKDSAVIKNLHDQIQNYQDQIKSYKDIIEEQKGIIQLLKENRK